MKKKEERKKETKNEIDNLLTDIRQKKNVPQLNQMV